MKLRRKLFSSKDPYDCNRSELFLGACKENFNHLITHCEDYKKIADGLNIRSADDIKNVHDIPVIPTMLMKQLLLMGPEPIRPQTLASLRAR